MNQWKLMLDGIKTYIVYHMTRIQIHYILTKKHWVMLNEADFVGEVFGLRENDFGIGCIF